MKELKKIIKIREELRGPKPNNNSKWVKCPWNKDDDHPKCYHEGWSDYYRGRHHCMKCNRLL